MINEKLKQKTELPSQDVFNFKPNFEKCILTVINIIVITNYSINLLNKINNYNNYMKEV